ncbi:putative lyase [Methanosarcina siciliae C2J]|uniref:Putative lyase n=2 Tax=Methanosarcina siciliae TaxID=38027 RepID=A0A0E3LCX1_9EURY|nr:putative lyase [Methanosarcina siciliae C2J]
MEYFVAEDKRPLDKCLEAVASSDLYVGIFAWRYGYRPPGHDSSITELEYRKAVECGKSCLLFILHEDAPWPRKLMDKGDDASKIEELRSDFSTNYVVSFFKSPEDLAGKVGTAVHKWENEGIINSTVKKTTSIDLEKYSKTISDKYRNLDLDTLTPSKKEDYLKIKLSNVFVEQNVRERMPPVELPKEMWKKIQEKWDPEKKNFPEELNLDEIKTARESYYSKEPRAVLDVINDDRNKQLVLLGDPGSGKSTLTRYLLLSVLKINGENELSYKFDGYLPLLIELRRFAAFCSKGKCESFFDYFSYLEKKTIFDLTKSKIEKYYEEKGKVLVIFDGLDEVFDSEEWETIVHMIAGFKNRYPNIRIIVTSRIVGYKRNILEDAGFSHFTIQEFEETQIKEFLDKWYPIVLDNEDEIAEKKNRIFRALKDSSSIRELAGNPLLLTILAIVGKHQELPRERWKLYDHAAGVLVEHWDVNRHLKDKQIKIDAIGEEDKKDLLKRIACKMQSGPKGLSGNFIHKKDLLEEIEQYLKFRYEIKPIDARTIAIHMVNQLRERNFVLCLYGADVFGFVHRTFLEYFCAMDIVQKFDNHELNIETLKSDYFEKYWEDPTWHEVLRLVCGMKEKFAGEIIESLMQTYNQNYFLKIPPWNIVLSIKCLSELRTPNTIDETAKKLLERVLKLFEMVRWTQDINRFLAEEVVPAAKLVGDRWPHREIIIDQFSRSQVYTRYYSFSFSDIDFYLNNVWAEFITGLDSKSEKLHDEALKKINYNDYSSLLGVLILGKYEPKDEDLFSLFLDLLVESRYYFVRQSAVRELAHGWHDDPETLNIIKQRAATDKDYHVRGTAVNELAHGWHDDPETLNIIKQRVTTDEDGYVRGTAVNELARGWHDDPEALNIIKQRVTTDEDGYVRGTAVQELTRGWHDDPETLNIIKQRVTTDENEYVRSAAVQELARGWHDDPGILKFIKQMATTDKDHHVRSTAVQELAHGWHDDPETLNIIKQRITTDKDYHVRSTAVQELAHGWHDDPETLNIIKQRATTDKDGYARRTAVQELARGWHEDPETLNIVKQMVTTDKDYYVRSTADQELARGWHEDPETLNIIKQRATTDKVYYVRSTAVQELTRGWHDDPETLNIIKQRVTTDKDYHVRGTAVQELARGWHDDPETLNIIKQRATTDKDYHVRSTAVQELARGWHDDPETLNIIKQRVTTDEHEDVRSTAVQELARGWSDDPETLNIIKQRVTTDEHEDVQSTAVQELARGWHDDPETLKFIKQMATTDKDYYVRSTAVQELARGWHDDPKTLNIIKQRATTDKDYHVRGTAVQELARGWHDDPETLNIIKQRATTDKDYHVRGTAVQELARGWHDDPETLNIIKQRATTDEYRYVRRTAVQELIKWWSEEAEENIEDNVSFEIITHEDKSIR